MKRYYGYLAILAALGALTRSNSAAGPVVNSPASVDSEDLEVQYAQTKVELAKANLKRVEAMNRRVARAVSPNVAAQYQDDMAFAQLRLESSLAGKPDSYAVWLKSAELNWKSAKADWQSAVAANRKQPGTVNPLDVERLRLEAEVLRIGLVRGEALIGSSREAQTEWRLGMLSDQIDRLSDAVFRAALSPGRPPLGINYYYLTPR